MNFEYDNNKSESNKAKHGIDFEEAQVLWNDDYSTEFPARSTGEKRAFVVGRIGKKHWTAVLTYRKDTIRIISARSSRTRKIIAYESQRQNRQNE